MEPKRLIEAALFMSGRELSVPELKKLTGIASAGHIRGMIEELQKDYGKKGSSLEIFEADGAYIMRVKEDYVDSVRQFAQAVMISKSALRTLSYVARHNGILKSEVVKRIGTMVYDDVRELVENGFILQRKYGRSSKLFLTDKFRAYFEPGKAPATEGPMKKEGSKEVPVMDAESFSDMEEGEESSE
ncbi:MAG: SMC-Scp complex subunit ScpB [bacterium]|nr:SMC-Scp complex subunit ScpB [bacterium]